MGDAVQAALANALRIPNSTTVEGFRELFGAMLDHYKEQMLEAKPEQLPALQCYARQVRQLKRALDDPGTNRPTV